MRLLKRSKRVQAAILLFEHRVAPITVEEVISKLKMHSSVATDLDIYATLVLRCCIPETHPVWELCENNITRGRIKPFTEVFDGIDRSLKLFNLHRVLFVTDVLFDVKYDKAK